VINPSHSILAFYISYFFGKRSESSKNSTVEHLFLCDGGNRYGKPFISRVAKMTHFCQFVFAFKSLYLGVNGI